MISSESNYYDFYITFQEEDKIMLTLNKYDMNNYTQEQKKEMLQYFVDSFQSYKGIKFKFQKEIQKIDQSKTVYKSNLAYKESLLLAVDGVNRIIQVLNNNIFLCQNTNKIDKL